MTKQEEIRKIWGSIVAINIVLAITFVGLLVLVLWLIAKGVL